MFFLDVITIEKTGEFFRLIYDVKGRFTIHRITAEEAKVCFLSLKCSLINLNYVLFVVQALQSKEGANWTKRHPIFGDSRWPYHPLPRSID